MAAVLRLIACKSCGASVMRPQNSKYCEPCKEVRTARSAPRACRACGGQVADRQFNHLSWYCAGCEHKARKVRLLRNDNEVARKLTKYAVKIGFLPHPSNYICMDCKRVQAECYDHRDYSKPLEVDAVCLPCNATRGKGIPLHLSATAA